MRVPGKTLGKTIVANVPQVGEVCCTNCSRETAQRMNLTVETQCKQLQFFYAVRFPVPPTGRALVFRPFREGGGEIRPTHSKTNDSSVTGGRQYFSHLFLIEQQKLASSRPEFSHSKRSWT